MKKAYLALFLGVALGVAHGQVQFPYVIYTTVDPTGTACSFGAPSYVVFATGILYTCDNGLYAAPAAGGPPTGAAGGDLGRTYPNPSVVGLNGVSLAGLGTGFLFNTTGTGVPSSVGSTGTGNVVRAASPTVSDPTVTGSFTATGLVTNADLANPATTVNGQTCTLGSSCTVSLSAINPQTATYQVLAGDFSNYKTITVASGTFAITLVASGTQPAAGQYINIINYGTGVVTAARSGQNINGGTASIVLPASAATTPTSMTVFSDGTNYFAAASTGAFAGIVSSGNSFNSTRSDNAWFATTGNTTAAFNFCNSGFTNCMIYTTSSKVLTVPTGITVTTGPIIQGSTKFTTSGCSVSSTTGNGSAGIFTLGANTCTVVITFNGASGLTAPIGWSCDAHDRTTIADIIGGESSSTQTTASIVIPVTVGATDVISFKCSPF